MSVRCMGGERVGWGDERGSVLQPACTGRRDRQAVGTGYKPVNTILLILTVSPKVLDRSMPRVSENMALALITSFIRNVDLPNSV